MRTNVIIILLPLFFYKYFEAINIELFHALEFLNISYQLPQMTLFLPVGISFYTFMAIGYTIDVYNEDLVAEKNLGKVALFLSFFPLVLSGPIERAGNILPQFNNFKKINVLDLSSGLKIMLWGYFMKLVVADRLGIYIDHVYEDIAESNGTSFIITTILYPFQVYADLGGYSLIAIGAAKVMGIDVIHNFRRPFFAVSMSDFWRRWHISLISWITDYVYTPLAFAFRKRGKWGIVLALMVAFLLSGLWHGAALTFVAWGLVQGVFLSVEALTVKSRKDFRTKHHLNGKNWFIMFCCIFTFFLFAISQVFGRAATLPESGTIFLKMFTDLEKPYLDVPTLGLAIATLSMVLLSDFRDEFFPGRFKIFHNRYFAVRFSSYVIIFFMIIFLGVVKGQFIYFKF